MWKTNKTAYKGIKIISIKNNEAYELLQTYIFVLPLYVYNYYLLHRIRNYGK